MIRNPIIDAQIASIMQAPKVISSDIIWEKNPYENWLKSEVEVENNLILNLKLYLNVNSNNYNLYSFSLILNNIFCISRFDANGSHKNKHTDNNNWKGATHKHKWTAQCRDRWAFTPTDIDESSI